MCVCILPECSGCFCQFELLRFGFVFHVLQSEKNSVFCVHLLTFRIIGPDFGPFLGPFSIGTLSTGSKKRGSIFESAFWEAECRRAATTFTLEFVWNHEIWTRIKTAVPDAVR